MTHTSIIDTGAARIEVLDGGSGPPVVMLASLGRPASDFDDLARRVSEAGYRVLRPQPRGIGRSEGPMENVSLDVQAADVAAVIRHFDAAPAVLVGHAFGNRLARNTARLFPDFVSRLVLLACGGQVPIAPQAGADLLACFDLSLAADVHLMHVRRGFFADGNDASVWAGGWYPQTAAMQSAAVRASDHAAWMLAGGQPMLVVQALQDAIAPPANAAALLAAAPDRIRVVEIDGAGHAMLPERPVEIAEAVLGYLGTPQSKHAT